MTQQRRNIFWVLKRKTNIETKSAYGIRQKIYDWKIMAVRKINIDDSEISVIFGLHDEDYICLTDMVKAGDNSDRTNIVIQNWMRRKDTISYLGVWENLHNPDFKSIEFDAIKNASRNSTR